MSKPPLKLIEAAAMNARAEAFDEMFKHMISTAHMFCNSVFEHEQQAGKRMVKCLTAQREAFKAEVTK